MPFLDFLGNTLVSVLVVYLSLVNTFAERIETYFTQDTSHIEVSAREKTPSVTASVPSEKLTLLSRLYAHAGGIPAILKENSAFQDAARGAEQLATVQSAFSPETPINVQMKASIVNILCEYKTDAYTRTTTGTGFFIHENGVILTNAHVAQFLLLKGTHDTIKAAGCIVRSGDPATPRYKAELLFISPTWISHNAKLITEETPRGTGEFDYALLYVAGSLDGTPLPTVFPAIPVDTTFLSKNLTNAEVLTAGYPAEKLFQNGANAKLIPKVASTTIHELYTFGSNYADIFSIGSTQVGEQGASGGPIVLPTKGAIGLIVTKGDELTDGTSSLRGLTLSYIDRTIQAETGFSLIQNAQGDLPFRSEVFAKALAPFLGQLLTYELRDTE